jgi:hypothetical protein
MGERRKSAEVELVESALFAVVKFEEAAARFVASAFRVGESSTRYRGAVASYRIASAERLAAHHSLHTAVSDYAQWRRRDGIRCEDAVLELTRMANRATRSELARAERRQLNDDITRWAVLAYAA